MADDDDVPEELWDMLDNLGHSKNPTMTQAPVGGLQQSTAPRIPVTAQHAQHNSLPTWRPQHMQQLPVAPPPKPASLAQQLAGTGQFPPAPAIRFQPSINQATGLPRYMQQQHQPWQPRQQYGTSQWSTSHQNGNQQALQPLQPPQQEVLDTAPAHAAVGPANRAPITADAAGAAAQLNMQPTQTLSAQQLQQEVARLRKDLDTQAGMTTQLRNKLHQAEQEKQQLQQRVQHQQYPSNSIAQHKTKELEKQAQNLQQQLDFLNQELSDAKRKASDKESKASEAENKLKQLQEELRRKEDQMLQLQFELDHEKQRAERLTANPAAAAAGASGGGTGSYSRQSLNGLAGTVNHTYGLGQAQGFVTPGSSGGRKRRLNTAGASAAAAAQSPYGSAGRVQGVPGASQQQQLTPLQQHSMQMQQLLQGRPGARIHQQQQQQQQQQEGGLQQQDVQVPDELAAIPVQKQQQQQQEQQQPMLVDQPKAPQQPAQASAGLQQQQQQHTEEQQSGLISLLTRVQQLQVRQASLSMLLWNTCKSALQQLLQPISTPISIQVSAISRTSTAAAAAAGPVSTADPPQVAVSSNLAALSAVQQQLQAVATNSSNSNTTDLLLQLLQLASVLIPAGGLGLGDYSNLNSGSNTGPATQAVHSAAGAAGSSSRWVLQQPASPTAAAAAAGITGGSAQQQQQYLVFQAVDDPQAIQVLPLPLAIAVLQLVQGLAQHDTCCLHVMAAAVGAAQAPGSQLLLHQDAYSHRGSSRTGVDMQADSIAAGLRPAVLPAATDSVEGSLPERASSYSMRQSRRGSQSSAAAAAVSYWASVEAAAQSVLLIPCISISSSSMIWAGTRLQADHWAAKGHKRTLFALLADACRSHASLQEPVGAVLATLAGRLPATLRHLLLPAAADSTLVVQLLHSEGYQQRCQAVAFLQEMLLDAAVTAAFAAAVDSTSAAATAGGNLGQDAAMVDTAGVDNLAQAVPLQQLQNRNISYTQRSSRAAAKAAVAAAFQEKPQQQQQQQQQQQKGSAAIGTPGASDISSLSTQAVYDLLYGLLECISSGVGDLPRHPQSSTDHSCSSSSLSSSTRTADPYSSAASSSVSSSGRAWGVFELQRRACAVIAEIMLTKQDVLLLVMLDGSFTSGSGLSQRLLALIDAACSAQGGDPFCTATPLQPQHPTAAAAADAAAISKVTGVRCAWWECLERVRLAHEAVLLLRALVAAVPPLGHAATADLCSNLTSLRMVQTTRAKLSEWSDALVATATAAAAQGVPVRSTYPTAAAGEPAAGAAALPLAPWAWAFSSSCGCRDKHSGISTNRVGRSSGAVASSVSEQLIRSQRPLLQDSLQEISNAAASVHRRAIYHIS